MQDFVEVGHVKELWRYPVKSMGGEQIDEAHVYWYGIDGDRRAAFVRSDDRSGFPWLTARQIPKLALYRPFFTQPDDVLNSPVSVETPDSHVLPLDSPYLQRELAQAYGQDVSLIRIARGIYDTLNLSLMSVATTEALAAAVDFPLDGRRFRQNMIIETLDGRPFAEESWVGNVLLIGEVQIRLNQPIKRCQMINVDPVTAVREPRVLKMVAQSRNNCVGVACTPETIGFIRVGDRVKSMAHR
ncbi:MAG: MOSC domain-containing protein [Chloroflexi bacterium]|nr:MOSC domain-containing protein [Chloroflexota bacterium]